MPLRLNDQITIPDTELRWRFSRSSGPGGQSVNTTDSRVELTFDLHHTEALPPHLADRARHRLATRLADGTITVTAAEHKSQLQNRKAAAERLTALLRDAIAPPAPPRRPTKPSKAAKRRRLETKRRRSQVKRLRRRSTDD